MKKSIDVTLRELAILIEGLDNIVDRWEGVSEQDAIERVKKLRAKLEKEAEQWKN